MLEELAGLLAIQHVLGDRFIEPGQGAQRRVEVRVREEADVEQEVGVRGRPVLEAEALDRDRRPDPLALVRRRDHASGA